MKCWACGSIMVETPDHEGWCYCPNEMCLMDEEVERV